MRLTVCLLALAAAAPAAAESPKCKFLRVAEWQVRTGHYAPVVDGAINGDKVGVLLDTGAYRSVVYRSAALKLGLTLHDTPGGPALISSTGETGAHFVLVDELRVGEFKRKNWRVLVVGQQDTSASDLAVILGEDFFRHTDVEFDLANNAVRLYEPKDCAGVSLAYWTKKPSGVAIEGEDRVRFTVSVNGKPVAAQLSSARSSVLASTEAERFGVTAQSPGVVAGGCVSGSGRISVESWIGTFESFAIGDELIRSPQLRFADLWKRATYTETGSRLPTQLAGLPQMLLGADFLRSHRVLIARSQHLMYFTYNGGTVFPSTPGKSCDAPAK